MPRLPWKMLLFDNVEQNRDDRNAEHSHVITEFNECCKFSFGGHIRRAISKVGPRECLKNG